MTYCKYANGNSLVAFENSCGLLKVNYDHENSYLEKVLLESNWFTGPIVGTLLKQPPIGRET